MNAPLGNRPTHVGMKHINIGLDHRIPQYWVLFLLTQGRVVGYAFCVASHFWGCALSGLQSFVYDVPSEGAAKRLRARSAALVLVPALIAYQLLRKDPNTQFLYLGGGKVLCCTSGADEPFLHMLREWTRELTQLSSGSLGLYWANGETPPQLLDALREAKWKSGREPNGEWFGHLGAPALVPKRHGLGDPEWEAEVGGEIARNLDAVGFSVGKGWQIVGDVRARLVLPNDATKPAISFSSGDLVVSLPRYVPMANNELKPFDRIAEEGHQNGLGYPYLAVLKMDGDHVGAQLGEALKEGLDGYQQLSRSLSQFYGTDIPKMFEERRPNIYLVYSGGDDLVAIGHFRDVLETALLVHSEYRHGTSSAGISFFHRNSPMLSAVERADRFLEQSKGAGRNKVTVGGQTVTWPELRDALSLSGQLADACKNDAIPRSIVQLLRELGEWFLDTQTGVTRAQINPCRALPLLSYYLSRRQVQLDKVSPELHRYFDDLCNNETTWKTASLVATLTSWKLREAKE